MEVIKYRLQTITVANGDITYSAQVKTERNKWEAIISSGKVPPDSLNYSCWQFDSKEKALKAIENHKKGGVEIKTIETEYL
jgi:threonine dehydrogenase-like Zn-dependent dehydrogenase